ncbi:MAG: cyclic nucleotide-binding/CBS domain-containing protein [Gammaproteobacteria bacterium]|nr:cyclic nucleotide-binding/CBS domain-containing protein [Gammaproteobacteria bacterium]MCB1925003.1 cyclic nucleotide-binding/CBS domain-containing protein [Gammaproteobacteria bacterium]
MEVELLEIRQFLEQRNPFVYLSDELLNELPADIEIRYLRRGSGFPPKDGFMYIVRSGAIEIYDDDDELCEKLGEGDVYSVSCQLVNLSQCARGEATEDTLLYMLTCARLKALCRASPAFSEHFSSSVKERLKAAINTIQESDDPSVATMMIEVGSLIRKQPITVESGMTIRQTAALMSNKDVSSVMVMQNDELVGLVTDRDLRKRCVAIGLTGAEPIDQIMTLDPKTIEASTLTAQALMTMTRSRFHHLPVTQNGKLIGMITATDLANQQSANSAYLAADVRKAKTVADLVDVSKRLPNLHLRLAAASVTARHIGEAVSCLTDSITGRLLQMAEDELGPPPVAYVWMAGGSQARHEQSSHSDQDNALLLADEFDKAQHDTYFESLAKFVSDGLNACGFVYCPGNAMATNPEWRQPLKVWQGYFTRWIESPTPMSMMLSSIFFDLRPVTGKTELFTPLQKLILKKSQENRIFLAYMMANAMQHRPPLGFFRQFVLERGGEHDDTLDLKHRGIVPITDIARLLALSLGKEPVNTVERLRACAGSEVLSSDMAENLEDALEFIASLRIRHQADQIRKGKPADNYVPPRELSELEREHLKHAFRVIQTMQESMVKRFGADKLG